MKNQNLILWGVGGLVVGIVIANIMKSSPHLKVNPITANPNNGLPVLHFEINGKSVEDIDGQGRGFGSVGDVTWSYTRDGKNYIITAYDTKTLKSSSAIAVRPSNIGTEKTK